jgi:hypothetical protein
LRDTDSVVDTTGRRAEAPPAAVTLPPMVSAPPNEPVPLTSRRGRAVVAAAVFGTALA